MSELAVTKPLGAGVSQATVTEDEAGLRLDRWFKRRVPALSLAHLAKICRKGEVRVDGKRVETSTRLEEGQTIRIPPLNLDAPAAPAASGANPEDARALRDMTLYEDADVLVLNKPFGLAVQGGSGTTRHIDGMLASLAKGDNRPVLVHRLDRDTSGVLLVAKNRRTAAALGEAFRSRQAKKIYWALVEGAPKLSQGRISLYLAKGEGMGDQRAPRKPGAGSNSRHRENARRASWRDRCSAFADLLRHRREGRAALRLAVDEAAHRPHASASRPCRGDRPSDLRRPEIRPSAGGRGPPPRSAARHARGAGEEAPSPGPQARAAASQGRVIDVTAPLPEHMRKTWEAFGFDEKAYDPIEDAPEA